MSWEVKFNDASFHTDRLWNNTHALIDPGYPFIGMPFHEFEKFEADLKVKYPEHAINCTKEDWCIFNHPCSEIEKDMPDLMFSFPDENEITNTVTYKVPSKSFLFNDFDLVTDETFCHLGIVAQSYKEFDHFILGQVFMENFYVTYDATNPDQLRVGISQMVNWPVREEEKSISVFAEVTLVTIAVLLGFAIALIGIWICVRHSK